MQKKIIALAVAGLVSGAAFAQSNVTIYGLVDMGWSYRSDNINDSIGSKKSIDSGIQSGNRLGFKGEEALGGGTKVGFVLENGFFTDTGNFTSSQASDRGFSRQAFLYYAGGFGTVAAGRQYTPQFNLITATDPFGTGLVGQINNLYTLNVRVDNTLAYISPNFGGLTITAAHATQALGQENAENSGDARVWAISPVYNNGPLMVGLNYHRIKANISGADAQKVWDFAGTYNLGAAKLAGAYGSRKQNDLFSQKSWMLGATVPMGPGSLLASYTRTKIDLDGTSHDAKARQIAVGYQYDLSKRTNAYVAYADINNNDYAAAAVGDSSNGGAGYQKGFNVGLRHKF